MRHWRLLGFLFLSGCSAASGPVVPSPLPAPAWTLSGIVVDTSTRRPISGARLLDATTATDGSFTATGPGLMPPSRVTVEADAYVSRSTTPAPVFDLFSSGMLGFYREFVRNGFEQPAALEPLRRWTTNPNFYLTTAWRGGDVDAATLAGVRDGLQRGVGIWTGGRLSAGLLESGHDDRAPQLGWIVVDFKNEEARVCGRAEVGQNPDTITFHYDYCTCGGAQKVLPSVVLHELGHALGFWHVGETGAVMNALNPGFGTCGTTTPTAHELEAAAIAYQRPVGNRDPDIDP